MDMGIVFCKTLPMQKLPRCFVIEVNVVEGVGQDLAGPDQAGAGILEREQLQYAKDQAANADRQVFDAELKAAAQKEQGLFSRFDVGRSATTALSGTALAGLTGFILRRGAATAIPVVGPPVTGYSQSTSMPSKPYCSMKSAQDFTKVARLVGSLAMPENCPDQVHPPTLMSVLRCGYLALSLSSWLKLPRIAVLSQLSPGKNLSTSA